MAIICGYENEFVLFLWTLNSMFSNKIILFNAIKCCDKTKQYSCEAVS